MRDRTKVVIGFGSIWGLWALGATLIGSFTIGRNDTAPEIAAYVLYGLTILPCCLLAIWYPKWPAWWLVVLCFISLFGFAYQEIHQEAHSLRSAVGWVFTASIPGLIGALLLWSRQGELTRASPTGDDGKRNA
jgi:hypothetical protein